MSLNRRTFLARTAATATAPLILPSRVWSAATAPSKQLTVGFIGTGKQSNILMRSFHANGFRVAAVCDVDTNRREDGLRRVREHHERNAEKAGPLACTMHNDFREVTRRADIDVVCIATPDHWHAIATLDALAHGKDVYCEKPLTHNIHEAKVLMEAVGKHGRVLQTGSMQRSSKEFRIACELVRNGVIGEIQKVDVSVGPPAVPCDLPEEAMEPGLDWNFWLGPAPMRPYNSILSPRGVHKNYPNWRNYEEYAGGQVADWGAHHFDIAQWGLGMDESGPVRITPPTNPGDKYGAAMHYANGVTVTHQKGNGVLFHGAEGEIYVNRGRFSLKIGGEVKHAFMKRDSGTSLERELVLSEREYLADKKISLYESQDHVGDFLQAVQNRTQPITHEGIGGRSAICCHLMNKTYKHHAELKWDPKAMQFTGGTGDPAWLTREYRGEWTV